MTLFSLFLIIMVMITNTSTAQVIVADYHDKNMNRDYYSIVHVSDGSRDYPDKKALRSKDILDVFISDPTTFI